jgi:hypothetical protein
VQHPFAGLLAAPALVAEDDLEAVVAGRSKPTTLAVGEEGAGRPPVTTLAFPEEGSGRPPISTRALGEE